MTVEEQDSEGAAGAPEMVACPRCSRMCPANRARCLYCGSDLELSDKQRSRIDPVLRSAEEHETAFNLVVLPGTIRPEGEFAASAAKMLGLDVSDIPALFGAGSAMPLARTASESEAQLIADRFSTGGIELLIVPDTELDLREPPVRLRGLEFGDDGLKFHPFNSDEEAPSRGGVELIVTGTLVRREVLSTAKKQRSGSDRLLESSEEGSDERLIDLYSSAGSRGYRIHESGFDFSCLGPEKKLLASENLPLLVEKLRSAFPSARFVDTYQSLRALLGNAWPVSERTASRGFERKSFGGYARIRSTETDNEEQFTRWSRLTRSLL